MGFEADGFSALLDPRFLEAAGSLQLESLTSRRDACRRAAASVAYATRLLRAHLEVLEAEAEWRANRLDQQLSELVESLAATIMEDLSDADGAAVFTTSTSTSTSGAESGGGPHVGLDLLTGASWLQAELADLASRASALDEVLLGERMEELRTAAALARARRRALQATVERLEVEIARRYKSGEADVAPPTAPGNPPGGDERDERDEMGGPNARG